MGWTGWVVVEVGQWRYILGGWTIFMSGWGGGGVVVVGGGGDWFIALLLCNKEFSLNILFLVTTHGLEKRMVRKLKNLNY